MWGIACLIATCFLGVYKMSGISAVSMIGYMNNISAIYQGQRLSAATKAKLEALGINTSNIKTEAEGKIKLQEVLLERASKHEKTAKSDKNSKTDSALERAKWLAKKLNVWLSRVSSTRKHCRIRLISFTSSNCRAAMT